MAELMLNGKLLKADEPVLQASNRSYRYGDGLFETIKVRNGRIQLAAFHMERLFRGIALLQFELPGLFTPDLLQKKIIELCTHNKCEKMARVRLSVFRGNGGLYDEDRKLQYLVECWPLPETVNELNNNGLVIDIYPDAIKSTDQFSGLKTANFLPYSMAAVFAKKNKLNDCVVLNADGGIADSTIANIFLVNERSIITPALTEGCVNGVMRRYLLQSLPAAGYTVLENRITAEDLLLADEVFLTNAIHGLRWVQRFRDKWYGREQAGEIYRRFCQTITA